MTPEFVTLIGSIAATLTTLSFFPQAIRTIRTQHTKDLSLGMYLAFTLGVIFWTIYGFLLGEIPIIIANIITTILAATILFLKIKNG